MTKRIEDSEMRKIARALELVLRLRIPSRQENPVPAPRSLTAESTWDAFLQAARKVADYQRALTTSAEQDVRFLVDLGVDIKALLEGLATACASKPSEAGRLSPVYLALHEALAVVYDSDKAFAV